MGIQNWLLRLSKTRTTLKHILDHSAIIPAQFPYKIIWFSIKLIETRWKLRTIDKKILKSLFGVACWGLGSFMTCVRLLALAEPIISANNSLWSYLAKAKFLQIEHVSKIQKYYVLRKKIRLWNVPQTEHDFYIFWTIPESSRPKFHIYIYIYMYIYIYKKHNV